MNFDIYENSTYDPDLSTVVEKTGNLLLSNTPLLNLFKNSKCYRYLLYTIYVYEKGIRFGSYFMRSKKNPTLNKNNYLDSQFYLNTINLISKIFLDEEKDLKEENNYKRVEEYLKWLFFYTLESENLRIINNYLKLIIEIYEKSKNYLIINIYLLNIII